MKDRDQRIIEASEEGLSLRVLQERFGISRERIRKIVAHPKPKRQENEAYLDFIRGQKCLAHQTEMADAHHLKSVGSGGSDYTAVPLCRVCHDTYHRHGLTYFEVIWPINLWKEAHRLLVEFISKTDIE